MPQMRSAASGPVHLSNAPHEVHAPAFHCLCTLSKLTSSPGLQLAGLKSAAAKAPSKYRNTWLGKAGIPAKTQRQLKELYRKSKFWLAGLIAIVVLFVIYRLQADTGRKGK